MNLNKLAGISYIFLSLAMLIFAGFTFAMNASDPTNRLVATIGISIYLLLLGSEQSKYESRTG